MGRHIYDFGTHGYSHLCTGCFTSSAILIAKLELSNKQKVVFKKARLDNFAVAA